MKRINNLAVSAIISIGIISFSCTKENEEDLSKQINDTCQADKAVYATIGPIFQSKCVQCHSGSEGAKGISLNSYEGVKNAAGKNLLKAIKHEPGVRAMPLNGKKLSDCEIAKIESWINRNFPQ